MAYSNDQLGKALEDLTIAYNNFKEKFTNAVEDALTETVILEIKQDSKMFIAKELETQKAELELAITQAKQAIDSYVLTGKSDVENFNEEKKQELQALIDNANTSINSMMSQAQSFLDNKVTQAIETIDEKTGEVQGLVNQMFIKQYMNSPYIQMPPTHDGEGSLIECQTPDKVFKFDGYRWKEIPRGGIHLRFSGGLAQNYGQTELQGDAIRDIIGFFNAKTLRGHAPEENLFKKDKAVSADDGWAGSSNNSVIQYSFKASRVVPTGLENSVTANTAIEWRLEEINENSLEDKGSSRVYVHVKENKIIAKYCGSKITKQASLPAGVTLIDDVSNIVCTGDDVRIFTNIQTGEKLPLLEQVKLGYTEAPRGWKLNDDQSDWEALDPTEYHNPQV